MELTEYKLSDLELELLSCEWICSKVRSSKNYAQNLYAALCNNEFVKNDVWPVLKDDRWSCSWRYAGGIVADIIQEGDYMDWYCSGIGFIDKVGEPPDSFVIEGIVTEEIKLDLLKLGWIVIQEDK